MKESLSILKDYFGYDSFRGVQEKVINRITDDKKHSLVLMPTGSGKSLCYQVPALMFDGGTVVISPLIALMQDQVDTLRKKNIPAAFINSTLNAEERETRLQAFLNDKLKLLYVTPERFRKKDFIERISKKKISLLAVDEAHCISEWGHDFRPDYSRIGEFRALMGNPLTIALTATATKSVQKDIIKKLHLNESEIEVFQQGIDRPNLRLEVRDVFHEKEKVNEISSIIKNYPGAGIIYFSLIQTLEKYSEKIGDTGIEHLVYHGKLSDRERKQNQRKFLAGDSLILATNAFGMGIDKPDIRFVIHNEVPSSIEAYYQEIGRAGRDGRDSICLLLYNQDDLAIQMDFIKWSNPDSNFYSALYDLLKRDLQMVNASGVDSIREQMHYKNRNDFRIETALNMMDRYGVTEGTIEFNNLKILSDLPEELLDEKRLKEKLLNDNKKLYSVVQYFKQQECRRTFISNYFGFSLPACGNCDNCTESLSNNPSESV